MTSAYLPRYRRGRLSSVIASRRSTMHKTILAALHLPEPARYFDFTTTGN